MAKAQNKLTVAYPSGESERKYRAEDALRTITRANEMMKDKALMRDVKACAREQQKALSKVTTPKKR